MTTIMLEIDDTILEDFYSALGAFPDPEWTANEARLWQEQMHLLPYLERQMVAAGEYIRRTRLTDAAHAQAEAETATLEDVLTQQRQARQDALPEKLRQTVERTPVEAAEAAEAVTASRAK